MKHSLLKKIYDQDAIVAIIGLGYVGLPLALCFCNKGFKVIGFDVDYHKIDMLKNGCSYISHIKSSDVAAAVSDGLSISSDISETSIADIVIICVPTPLNKHREPDVSFIIDAIDGVKPYLHSGQLISLESTTYPGTTEEVLQPRIESCGLKIGDDIFLVFSPEREDPANPFYSTSMIPKVCGGITKHCLDVGVALYQSIIETVVPVSSTRVAEMTKLLENIHRAVNIGLVNEMKIVSDKMGIDIFEVVKAAATKPFGYAAYYPGPGLGGHCIPVDPFYLSWKSKEYGIHTRFIELAGEVNASMPDWVISKIVFALNEKYKSIKGSEILVLGISYKKNVDDIRESPSIHLMDKLSSLGALISYSDPYVPKIENVSEYRVAMESIKLSAESISGYDCVLVATDHDNFDYEMIKRFSQLIVDTRGRFIEDGDLVIRA
ncbi:nucleotide sugar dehydrogenase [Aeromonas schubertii]|uniref:Nucleotide sugar dehydrogenase n=1 Tax=Aeromonas schubertii TaxID=652 RepID=A0ABS7VF89_9GAMM|nr:nucleotide sugar dehydrogenase [Aeromonas schubertii]MBZ6068049.1 nucleotide sugar dehydrogenase [Aeromonas schubertii]